MNDHPFGAGTVQIALCPSFSPGHYWEISRRGKEWNLYRSEMVAQRPDIMLLGLDHADFPSDQLQAYCGRLIAASIRILPAPSNMVGLDGTMTHLILHGDYHSKIQLSWWSHPPETWLPVVEITNEMIAAFKK